MAQLSGLDLPATLIFDYPSTGEIAAFVVSQLPLPVQQPALQQQPTAEPGNARRRARRPRCEKRAQSAAPAVQPALTAQQRLEIATALVRSNACQSGRALRLDVTGRMEPGGLSPSVLSSRCR